jgi:hypothetical protein
MTTRTRNFILGSFAVIVAGLCTGLVAHYGGLPMGGALAQGAPSELTYVPADATVVAYANVRDVMASELRRRLHDVTPDEAGEGQEEFRTKTGIDLEQDIDHVVAAMMVRAPGEEGESGFVAFRGRFDTVRLESLAREHEGTIEEYRGTRVVRLPAKHFEGKPERSPVLAFLEPGLVMFGDDRAVRTAIDTHASGQNVADNQELMELVRGVSGDANAWAVGRFDVLASRARLPEGISAQIPSVRWFSAAGRVNGGLSCSLRAETRDEQAAQNLRDVANGFLALARMQAGSKPELQKLMQSVTLSGSGKTVEMSFALPAELIEAMAPRQRRDN